MGKRLQLEKLAESFDLCLFKSGTSLVALKLTTSARWGYYLSDTLPRDAQSKFKYIFDDNTMKKENKEKTNF